MTEVFTVIFKDPVFSQRSIERKSMIFSESLRRCSKTCKGQVFHPEDGRAERNCIKKLQLKSTH